MEKALASLNNVYCRLGVSKISGVGIFAIRLILKGTNPFPDTNNEWVKVPIASLEAFHPNVVKMVDDFGVKEGEDIWIPKDGLNNLKVCYFMNHSENPNMIAMDGGDYFIAGRDIREGEELLADYRTYDEKGHATNF